MREGFIVTAALSLVVSSCSSGHMPRPSAPREEQALLDLAPDDAYLAVRLDLRAARATPHWPAIGVALAANGLGDEAPHLDATDRVWLVVGGLIEAPAFDAASAPGEDFEEEFVDESDADPYLDEGYPRDYADESYEQGFEDVAQPAWVPIAEVFEGRLPRAVLVVEGGASTRCEAAIEGQALRQVRGYRLGVVNGIAVLVRDQRCVLTPEPVLESLLSQGTGARTDVVGMLGRSDADQAGAILSYAVDFTAPSYAASAELQLADARAAVSAERARIQQQDEAGETQALGAFGEDGGGTRFAMANLIARNLMLWRAQTSVLAHEVTRMTARGFLGTTMSLSHSNGRYELQGRYAIDQADRATMWRELSGLYVGILRTVVATYDFPAPYQAALTAWLGSTRLERERDGFSFRAQASDEHVSAVVAALQQPEASTVSEDGDVRDPQTASMLARLPVLMAVGRATEVPPREAIALLEPHLEALLTEVGESGDSQGLDALSVAYDSVGRHADAVALMQRGIESWRQQLARYDSPEERSEVLVEMCDLAGTLCEQELRWGFAEAAEVAALTAAGEETCADVSLRAFYCQQLSVGLRGDARGALERIEARPSFAPFFYLPTRAQLLVETQQQDHAYQVIRSSCAGPFEGRSCMDTLPMLTRYIEDTSSSLEEWDALVAALRGQYPGDHSVNAWSDLDASSVAVADCGRRVRLAPRASETLTACTTARDATDRLHGTTHPLSIAARVYLASALRAARRTAELEVVTSGLEASRALVGPLHVLHRPPSTAALRRRPR